MKKIIVDTNIIFSFLVNTQGSISDLLFNEEGVFEFFSNEYFYSKLLQDLSLSFPAVSSRAICISQEHGEQILHY